MAHSIERDPNWMLGYIGQGLKTDAETLRSIANGIDGTATADRILAIATRLATLIDEAEKSSLKFEASMASDERVNALASAMVRRPVPALLYGER